MTENALKYPLFGRLCLCLGAPGPGKALLARAFGRHPELRVFASPQINYFYHRYVDDTALTHSARLETVFEGCLPHLSEETPGATFKLQWLGRLLDPLVDDDWYRRLIGPRDDQVACDFSPLNAALPSEAWEEIAEKCTALRVIYVQEGEDTQRVDDLSAVLGEATFKVLKEADLIADPKPTLSSIETHLGVTAFDYPKAALASGVAQAADGALSLP